MMPPIRELMTQSPHSIGADLPLMKAEEMMRELVESPYAVDGRTPAGQVLLEMARNKYGCAIVTNESGRAIGIFTAIDAVRMLAEVLRRDSSPLAAPFRTAKDTAGESEG